MRLLFTIILGLYFSIGLSQTISNWAPDYELTLDDFQSPQTEINEELTNYSIFLGTNMNFDFHMSAYQFVFTKNFNSKVKVTLNKGASVITAPNLLSAQYLIKYGQYNFDLTELYARKFRKEMYLQKGAFSDISFFQPIFKKIQEEMNAENARVFKATEMGKKEQLLKEEHEKILLEINTLSDFCLECKPPKKKKKKK